MTYTQEDINTLADHFGDDPENIEEALDCQHIDVYDDLLGLAMFLFGQDRYGIVEERLNTIIGLNNVTAKQLPGNDGDSILKRFVIKEGGIELQNNRWAFACSY